MYTVPLRVASRRRRLPHSTYYRWNSWLLYHTPPPGIIEYNNNFTSSVCNNMRMCIYNHTRRVRYIVNKRYDKFGNTSRKIHTFALTFAGIISSVRCINECMNTSTCRNGSFIKPRCNGNKLIGERRVHLCVHPWSRGSNVLSRRMVNGIAAPTRWQTLIMWIAALSKHYKV